VIKKFQVLNSLETMKVVAVIRGKNAEEAISISKAAIEGGFKAIEVTYTTPNVGQVFDTLADEQAFIGAGTVLDAETARHAILHGAKFIVSPHFNQQISVLCNRYSVPYLPGCLTISEIIVALESGCDVVKLFPANNVDPSFIKAVNGPLPHVQVMPTGGVHQGNISEWLDAGAFAVGVGSDLTKAFRSGGKEAVVELCKDYIGIIKNK
jgi:2-dehydro-3-deoxyphosphogluconate aldolase/(4S)-4-hydroxy-2-oxoglutarate aldolase